MIHDSERREVAARLRDYPAELVAAANSTDNACKYYILDLLECVGLGAQNVTSLFERLADLIEPPALCPHYMYPCCRTDAGGDYIDRDALLALADDIDKQTDGSMFDAWLEDGHYIARRIREALGVK